MAGGRRESGVLSSSGRTAVLTVSTTTLPQPVVDVTLLIFRLGAWVPPLTDTIIPIRDGIIMVTSSPN